MLLCKVLKYLFLYLNKPMLHLVTLICNLYVIYFFNLMNLCLLLWMRLVKFVFVKFEKIRTCEGAKFKGSVVR